MTLRLCIDCATIFDCWEGCELTCPRCGRSLELSEQLRDNTATFAEIAAVAAHGEAPRRRARWSIE